MNDNLNNKPSQNNRYSTNNWENHQNGPSYVSHYNQNNVEAKKVVKSCKSTASAYLWMFFIDLIFCVISIVYFGKFVYEIAINIDSSTSNNSQLNLSPAAQYDFLVFAIIIAITSIIGFILLVLAIVLTVKTNTLKKLYPKNESLWILFLIGIFILIPGLVAAFMTISSCKKIQKLNSGYSN